MTTNETPAGTQRPPFSLRDRSGRGVAHALLAAAVALALWAWVLGGVMAPLGRALAQLGGAAPSPLSRAVAQAPSPQGEGPALR